MSGWIEVGRHRLWSGRCEEALAEIAPDSVDVICTSPPYNLGIAYPTHSDRLPEEQYLDWLSGVVGQLARVLKPDGSLFLNIGGSCTQPWLPFEVPVRLRALRDARGKPLWHLQNPILWVKSITVDGESAGQFKPINSGRFLTQAHETVLHLTRTGRVPIDRLAIGVPYADKSNLARFGAEGRPDVRCRGNVWFLPYDTIQSREERFNHPAAFPLALPQWAIRLHGVADPVVLDPFCGTGTTLLAADLEGGRGLGIELDPGYCAITRDRLAQLRSAA